MPGSQLKTCCWLVRIALTISVAAGPLFSGSSALAAADAFDPLAPPLRPADVDDPEPPRGKDRLTEGIVLTAIGAGAAGYAVLYGLLACFDNCPRGETPMLVGAAIAGLGLGFGIPMIPSGAREMRDWRRWNRRHNGETATTKSFKLQLVPMKAGALAVATVSFD